MRFSIKTFKLIWLPKTLSVLFILFFSLFALDAFNGNASFYDKFIMFLVHLIPSFIMIIFLVFSQKHPAISGWIFIILGFIFTFFFNTYRSLTIFLIISLPPIIIGILFLISFMAEEN